MESRATSHPCDGPNMIPCDVQTAQKHEIWALEPNNEKAKSIKSCKHRKETFSNDDIVDKCHEGYMFQDGIEMTEKQT
jgi:hypothetical protein